MRIGTALLGAGLGAVVVWYTAVATPRYRRDYLSRLDAFHDRRLQHACFTSILSSTNRELPAKREDLQPMFDPSVWGQMERQYLRLPIHLRGFTNSIYERYVFVAPPLEARLGRPDSQVRIFMLTSQPRHTGGTNYLRTAFWFDGNQVGSGSVQETKVQELFSAANRPLPQVLPAAPATPPDWLPPGKKPQLKREELRKLLREQGYSTPAVCLAIYWPWSGALLAVASILSLVVVVRLLDRRRTLVDDLIREKAP